LRRHSKEPHIEKKTYEGNLELMISTGSTLLDLAISGKRKRGGGIPGGIMVEIFGPEGSGKTVLLCEIGGAIQRAGGDVMFNDPEARLNKLFAYVNGLNMDDLKVEEPDTVTKVFESLRNWEPRTKGKIHGVMTDSLAALSTTMEMENEDGDKMGMRRAKEFSEGLRKACRVLKQNNYILACSNQIRDNADAVAYGEKFSVPGGKAIAFYASLRIRTYKPEKVTKKKTVYGKEVSKVIGTKVLMEVYKNSCEEPYRKAHVYIDFKLGIDDVKANLQYLKDFSKSTVYSLNGESMGNSLDDACLKVFEENREKELKEAVIDLWEEIEGKFETKITHKRR
jgi:recombination protein RecA